MLLPLKYPIEQAKTEIDTRLGREMGVREKKKRKQKQRKKESLKAWLDDSFTCLNPFYTATPVRSPTTIGGNFPCVDKLHGSLSTHCSAIMRKGICNL